MPKYSKRRSRKSYKGKFSNRRRNTHKRKVRKKNRIKNYRGGAGAEGNLREHWRVGQAGERIEDALKSHLKKSVEIFPEGLHHDWSAWVPKPCASGLRDDGDTSFTKFINPSWIKPGCPVVYLNHKDNFFKTISDGSLPRFERMREME